MPQTLDPQIIADYGRDGAVVIRRLTLHGAAMDSEVFPVVWRAA